MPKSMLAVLAAFAVLAVTAGCYSEMPSEPVPGQTSGGELGVPLPAAPQSIGAYTSIAWPFGNENPSLWRGWEGDRTGGGTIQSCGGTVNSHSGADYYARDLSRRDGTSSGRKVYAGLAGKVVKAGSDGGYGNTVVIHYPRQRLLIRYSHLSSVAVRVGQQVSIRQYIGKVGNTPGGFAPHLHLVVYENVDTNPDGSPKYIPNLCRGGEWHACRIYFFC